MIDRHTRTRVYAPEETKEHESFYERKKGASGMDPVNFTAFREAERRFKAKGPLSLSDVLDLQNAPQHPRVRLARDFNFQGKRQQLYEVIDGGGFCFIPRALDQEEQKLWITRALSSYMTPPNATNLDAHYKIPQEGLWHYYKSNTTLEITRISHPDDSDKTKNQPFQLLMTQTDVAALIKKIRWVTLGYQYNWTTKEYDFERPPIAFPKNLALWSSQICEAAGLGAFVAEAGIVNFYQPGDTLTGHVDRSEQNMRVPLISLSLGADCIFLLGGASRNDPVLPILLRSGDIIFMCGPSRSYYHGVPRILSALNLAPSDDDSLDTKLALELLGDARINLNIRQVNH